MTALALAREMRSGVVSSFQWKGLRTAVSTTLLEQVASGDELAMRRCIETHGGLVWSLARRFLPTRVDAEDAVQEIFTDIWKSSGRFNPSVASETTFIAMIARRRLIDRIRRKTSRPDMATMTEEIVEDQRGEPLGLATTISDEDAKSAAEALKQLSVDQQRVLRLSLVEGKSHEQISKATGMPLGTVKTHARRGMIKLRELMSDAMRGGVSGGVSA